MGTFLNCSLISTVLLVLLVIKDASAIRCYQCSSGTDPKGVDACGAYKRFNRTEHIAIECSSDESHMPGSFCVKRVEQGPKGFVWDGRWRQVIRRCSSVSDTGVTGVCNWGVHKNGDYWEECYCSEDSCNSADVTKLSACLCLFVAILAYFR